MRKPIPNQVSPTPGWTWTTLGDISEVNPKTLPLDLRDGLDVSFLPMRSVEEQTGRFDLSIVRKAKEVRKGYTPVCDGDLIFAKITPCMENGKVAVLSNLKNGVGFGSTEFHVFRFRDGIKREFFFHFLLQQTIRREARRNMSGSAGQLRVPSKYMTNLKVPLPPLPEQHRIVEKIEALFSELDKGIEQLKTAQDQLKIYRQSVLKWAFEGKLTAEWRSQTSDRGTASELLCRIRHEREAQAKATGKRLKPIAPLTEKELAELPELPEGWAWARLEEVCAHFIDCAHRTPKYAETGIPALRPRDVVGGKLDIQNAARVSRSEYEKQIERHRPEAGDIVYSRELSLGWAIEVPRDLTICMSQGMVLMRPHQQIRNRFFISFLNGPDGRGQAEKAATGSAHPHLNLTDIKSYVLPIAPTAEQNEIVQKIETRLSVCDKLEETFVDGLRQSEALRQSILKKAFEGNLVPQDPNDPPASELLQRIKEEKVNREADKVSGKKKRLRRAGPPASELREKVKKEKYELRRKK